MDAAAPRLPALRLTALRQRRGRFAFAAAVPIAASDFSPVACARVGAISVPLLSFRIAATNHAIPAVALHDRPKPFPRREPCHQLAPPREKVQTAFIAPMQA
ncbi:hypothetical protein [Lysobacter enzymogenes]|uniref:hypothetical protein n=1 Tax=Lysobacter enzymogenes TaxID=69 RepID=UPI001A970EE8|nr:hypothetical protein [Lysobacter enzymogenes]QQP98540.1 hypothetical protein JHW38_11410 [Lysobacter enzymogenes]